MIGGDLTNPRQSSLCPLRVNLRQRRQRSVVVAAAEWALSVVVSVDAVAAVACAFVAALVVNKLLTMVLFHFQHKTQFDTSRKFS